MDIYMLMHKETPVAEVRLPFEKNKLEVTALHQASHLPVGVSLRRGKVDTAALNDWWIDRFIPDTRSGLNEALSDFDLPDPYILLILNHGLSLSDHYWLAQKSTLSWEQLNFFTNPFPTSIGDALMGKRRFDGVSFRSPDLTCNGNLKKCWAILDGKRCLVKAGSGPFQQQPFNEVIASKMAERLGIPHIPYTVIWDEGLPYSVCEDFVTPDTELIPAWRMMQTQKKDNQTSVYQHYRSCCKKLGISNMAHALDQMLVLDYLIANEDRHFNNFGLLRNPDTLEWLGPAPIYDSGSCLGYDKLTAQIRSGRNITCKPFKKTHQDQLRLVTSFDWLDLSKLGGIEQDIREVFAGAEEFIDKERVEAIVTSVNQRIQMLETFTLTQQPQADSTENDVERNVASEYGMGQQL